MPERACKAGALPAELHAHAAETINSQQFTVSSAATPTVILVRFAATVAFSHELSRRKPSFSVDCLRKPELPLSLD